MSTCRKCGVALTPENAVRHKKSRTGYDTICKRCNADLANAWYRANRERALARGANRYREDPTPWREAWERTKSDPVKYAQHLATSKTYREKNREKVTDGLRRWYAEHGQAYYQKNRARLKAASLRNYYANEQGERAQSRHKAWKSANHDRWRLLQTNAQNARKARLYGCQSKLDGPTWASILQYFNHACAYCLRTNIKLEQEHVVAIARGGAHNETNVVPACRTCNAKKKDRAIFCML